MKWHYIEKYIASTVHRITVNLIGCGGTGSHVLTNLAMMNYSLIKLGKQPLAVRVWDDDIITEYNIGRQQFSPADIGEYKAEILVTRINRYYGFDWIAINERYETLKQNNVLSNITISCVDSVKSRKDIGFWLENISGPLNTVNTSYYWMDIGNNKDSGQIILGTTKTIKQPDKKSIEKLPTFCDEYPHAIENINEPSCSMAESLAHQDLFINKLIATYGTHIFWDLINNFRINYRGLYINLKDMKTSKINL